MSVFERIASKLEIIDTIEMTMSNGIKVAKHTCDNNSLLEQFNFDNEIILDCCQYTILPDSESIEVIAYCNNITYIIQFGINKLTGTETYNESWKNKHIHINILDIDETHVFANRKLTNYVF